MAYLNLAWYPCSYAGFMIGACYFDSAKVLAIGMGWMFGCAMVDAIKEFRRARRP